MPDIIVQDINPRRQILAGAGQMIFGYTFAIFQSSDLNVYRTPVGIAPNDTTQILILNADYTVTNNPAPAVGGIITLTVPTGAGDIITIVRNMPYTFLNNFIDGGPFTATIVNTDFDANVMMTQQDKMYDRLLGIHYNNTAIINASTTPPLNGIDNVIPVLPPNSVWMKNAANNQIVAVTIPSIAGPGGSVVPSVTGTFPIYANTTGLIESSTFLAPTTQGPIGQPIITDGNNPAQLSFPRGGFIYQYLFAPTGAQQMLNNTGYICDNAGTNLLLPNICPLGTRIQIVNDTGGVAITISQNAGQTIEWHGNSTTLGVAGNLSFGATNNHTVVTLLCILSDTLFIVESTTATDMIFT